MANETFIQIPQVKQAYLNDFLTYLSYLIDKAEVDDAEDKYQETLRKQKRAK